MMRAIVLLGCVAAGMACTSKSALPPDEAIGPSRGIPSSGGQSTVVDATAVPMGTWDCPTNVGTLCPSIADVGDGQFWVGCTYQLCDDAEACVSCLCVDSDGGAMWNCDDEAGAGDL